MVRFLIRSCHVTALEYVLEYWHDVAQVVCAEKCINSASIICALTVSRRRLVHHRHLPNNGRFDVYRRRYVHAEALPRFILRVSHLNEQSPRSAARSAGKSCARIWPACASSRATGTTSSRRSAWSLACCSSRSTPRRRRGGSRVRLRLHVSLERAD